MSLKDFGKPSSHINPLLTWKIGMRYEVVTAKFTEACTLEVISDTELLFSVMEKDLIIRREHIIYAREF